MRKRNFRVKKKKPFFKKKFFGILILGTVSLGLLFYLIVFSPFFQINEFTILGNQKVNSHIIKNFLESSAERKIFLWKTRSIFLTDIADSERRIKENNPQIESVHIEKNFPHSLIVEIKERKPIAIFCQKENCFFLDKNGIIFEKTSDKGDLLLIEGDNNKSNLNLGKEIIPPETVFKILKVENGTKDIKFLSLSIKEPHKFIFKTKEGPEIYFDFQGDLNQQIFNLETFLREKVKPENLKVINYIDVRFGNRVFWKEKSVDNEK